MNCRCIKIWWVLGCFILFQVTAMAQEDSTQTSDTTIETGASDTLQGADNTIGDTSVISSDFTLPADSLNAWSRGSQFRYMIYIDSLLKARKGLYRMDTVRLGSRNYGAKEVTADAPSPALNFFNSAPVRVFFYIAAIGFVLYLVYRLFLSQGGIDWRRRGEPGSGTGDTQLELSDADAYDQFIGQAEEKGDLNLATRYLFLQSLKKLSDAGFIHFTPEKTDDQYVKELGGQNFQGEFNELTLNYEYIWYGKFAISRDYYSRLKAQFGELNQKL